MLVVLKPQLSRLEHLFADNKHSVERRVFDARCDLINCGNQAARPQKVSQLWLAFAACSMSNAAAALLLDRCSLDVTAFIALAVPCCHAPTVADHTAATVALL